MTIGRTCPISATIVRSLSLNADQRQHRAIWCPQTLCPEDLGLKRDRTCEVSKPLLKFLNHFEGEEILLSVTKPFNRRRNGFLGDGAVFSPVEAFFKLRNGFLGDGMVPETSEPSGKRPSRSVTYLAVLSPIWPSKSFKTISTEFQAFCNRSRGFVAYLTVL